MLFPLLRLAALAGLLLAGACASPQGGGASSPAGAPTPTASPAALPQLTIDAADYSFTVPDTIPAGWVRVTLKNGGKEIHHVQFFRANAGVTAADLTAAIQKGPPAVFAIAKAEGGAGSTIPSGTSESIVELSQGTYMLVCFIPAADGAPHFAKGMSKTFAVTGSAGAAAPVTEGTVSAKDFTFPDFPATLAPGRHLFKFTNAGPQQHEINFLKLTAGKTQNDVLTFFASPAPPAGPPPFTPAGGTQAITSGETTATIVVDLQPGDYVAICNVPDPASGKSHLALGMIKQFSVK